MLQSFSPGRVTPADPKPVRHVSATARGHNALGGVTLWRYVRLCSATGDTGGYDDADRVQKGHYSNVKVK